MYKEILQIHLALNELVHGNITKRFRKKFTQRVVLISSIPLVHMGRKAVKMRTAASRARKKAQVTEPVGLHDIASPEIELSDTTASHADIELTDTAASPSPADIEFSDTVTSPDIEHSDTIEVSHYLKDLQPQTCRS